MTLDTCINCVCPVDRLTRELHGTKTIANVCFGLAGQHYTCWVLYLWLLSAVVPFLTANWPHINKSWRAGGLRQPLSYQVNGAIADKSYRSSSISWRCWGRPTKTSIVNPCFPPPWLCNFVSTLQTVTCGNIGVSPNRCRVFEPLRNIKTNWGTFFSRKWYISQ